MLENEKHAIQGFRVWYPEWQDRMKAANAMPCQTREKEVVKQRGTTPTRDCGRRCSWLRCGVAYVVVA